MAQVRDKISNNLAKFLLYLETIENCAFFHVYLVSTICNKKEQ